MSTLKVDKIEPFSGGQVEITGLNVTGFATTGSNTFTGDQTITGSLTISSSTEFDVDVTGRVKIQGPTTGQIPKLTISGSDFFTEHNRFGSTYNQNGQLTYGVQVTNGSAYWGMYSSSFEEDVSFILKTSDFAADGIAAPGFVFWNGSDYVTPLQFKSGTNWGDGTTTFKTPLDISGSLRVSESVNISQVLTLKPLDPLPSADTGSLAVSGSNLYYYNGTTWSQIN